MDTRVKENPATGSHGVELPSLARLRMASVADQHVDAAEPTESPVRCNSQRFANGGKEAVVVPDEAWRWKLVRELLQLTCDRRRCRERWPVSDRPPERSRSPSAHPPDTLRRPRQRVVVRVRAQAGVDTRPPSHSGSRRATPCRDVSFRSSRIQSRRCARDRRWKSWSLKIARARVNRGMKNPGPKEQEVE